MKSSKEMLLSQSKAVRTGVLSEVRKLCDTVKTDYDGIGRYSTNIQEWLLPVIDLRDYHVYPMCGITEGLNWWSLKEHRGIDVLPGDYQWINRSGDGILYASVPSSIDGNIREIARDRPVALDLAYIGSTAMFEIDNRNVEFAFYSLSKPFGIRNVRTGWYFTKVADHRLEDLIYGAKYYNYHAHHIAELIIERFQIDYVHGKLQNQQKQICESLGLSPADSVWLANSIDEEYSAFRRDGRNARICLAGLYEYGT